VQCDAALRAVEAPVVYVVRGEVKQLVNYRLEQGTRYKVDRLLGPGEAFELRVGSDEAAQVVRVERAGETNE
jgi:hypothetical protein